MKKQIQSEPYRKSGIVAASHLENEHWLDRDRYRLLARPNKQRILYLALSLFFVGIGLFTVLFTVIQNTGAPFLVTFPSWQAFVLLAGAVLAVFGVLTLSQGIPRALRCAFLLYVWAVLICSCLALVRRVRVTQGTVPALLTLAGFTVIYSMLGWKFYGTAADRHFLYLCFFRRGERLCAAPLVTDLYNRPTMIEISVEAKAFRGCERYFFLTVSRRLKRLCDRKKWCFVGLNASPDTPALTYSVLAQSEADEKTLERFFRGFRVTEVKTSSRPDADRVLFERRMPTNAEMYSVYNRLILSERPASDDEVILRYPVFFFKVEDAALFAADAQGKYPDTERREENFFLVTVRTKLTEEDLLPATDALVNFADGYGGEVCPWELIERIPAEKKETKEP